ncbi:hypothetical protein [Clostridium novyi]
MFNQQHHENLAHIQSDLNTSYVNVQLVIDEDKIVFNTFKYILC